MRVTHNSNQLKNLWPSNSRSNWNLEMLVFEEGRKPENPEKNPQSKGENQQQTQPTYDAGSGNQTRDITVHIHSIQRYCSRCSYWFKTRFSNPAQILFEYCRIPKVTAPGISLSRVDRAVVTVIHYFIT